MAIGVDQIYLSMTSSETGEYLTANIYTVDGVYEADGVTLRQLSIGQVIMALCLQRAAQLENGYDDPETGDFVQGIVGRRSIKNGKEVYENGLMDDIEDISEQLELMTKIEQEVLDGTVNMGTASLTYKNTPYTYFEFLTTIAGMEEVPSGNVTASSDEFISALESAMDSKNSFSQQTMIKLQALTNKRDQSYDLISNALKSINTVLIGTINNM
ncbi:MAG: hypothetical protein E7049_06470 [Lentisphaerae bacterium]|jgi:hypothetical protein|nr:hypothetical protein [Lentisphaerota bacterium]